LVADIAANGDIKTVAFEFKFFGSTTKWEEDLEKLQRYGVVGWDYGHFSP
jgi:hypothetical protein